MTRIPSPKKGLTTYIHRSQPQPQPNQHPPFTLLYERIIERITEWYSDTQTQTRYPCPLPVSLPCLSSPLPLLHEKNDRKVVIEYVRRPKPNGQAAARATTQFGNKTILAIDH